MFRRRLREERTAQGLTQDSLATRASEVLGTRMYESGLNRIENGSQSVSLRQAVALASVLQVDLAELLAPSSAMDADAALAAAEDHLADLQSQEHVITAERQIAAARVDRLRRVVGYSRKKN